MVLRNRGELLRRSPDAFAALPPGQKKQAPDNRSLCLPPPVFGSGLLP